MAMLSPGVQVVEIDASAIVPTVSNSVAVFGGSFVKGQVGQYTLISNLNDLVSFYGYPTNSNYNDWYQAYNFLQYGDSLLVSRAANSNGKATVVSGKTITGAETIGSNVLEMASTTGLSVGDYITIGTFEVGMPFYKITAIVENVSITIDRGLEEATEAGATVSIFDIAMNAHFEAVDTAGTAVLEGAYIGKLKNPGSYPEYEMMESSIAFADAAGKYKFIAKNPGSWGNDIELVIAKPADFFAKTPSMAFDGIGLDEQFDYAPIGNQLAIIIADKGEIVEKFIVSSDPTEKDINNKSIYIENVLNLQSNYLFCKDNTANTDAVKSYLFESNGVDGTVAKLILGQDGTTGTDDIMLAYELFSNKENIDIDIVIGNEAAPLVALDLAETRKDCIAFIGAKYGDCVGKKASDAVSAIVTTRKTGDMNVNSMFTVLGGNYLYQYDRFNDVNRWINCAGAISGLNNLSSVA